MRGGKRPTSWIFIYIISFNSLSNPEELFLLSHSQMKTLRLRK